MSVHQLSSEEHQMLHPPQWSLWSQRIDGLWRRALIIPMIIRTIRLAPSRSDATDDAPNLSWADPSGADQSDAEHPPTDLAVGGSSPSRRAKPQVRGCQAKEA